MRVFIELAYDGTNYHGWQRQPVSITVQQVLEEALTRMCGSTCQVLGCGRTDAEVHASYFVAHADLPDFSEENSPKPRFDSLSQLAFKLNGMLGSDVAIYSITEVGDKAHARFDALERSYTYLIHNQKDPFLVGRSARIFGDLDIEAMRNSARHLIFQGDFASFCKTGSDVKTTICDVRRLEIIEESSSKLRFEISADRYLRNMVRAIIGTLLEVGKGKMTEQEFIAVIASCNRSEAGRSAPGCGLYLSRVEYPQEVFVSKLL
ncbi:MAG TPA: tRNA pseudouridine(38-40) synthase TruA [Flavobacteriales bacterium]|nr:tRNA pseudouridine(38-40) synthase TruA [Flavobacteriales bacterium]HIN41984.1 tRNA pseudouridine(38-40) synthase TruA [Flavobacteriales bacterium]HIO15868.1 tRNA pseudouridine(38-40) synthase TruA [Flavobacteriales bacterium]HIO59268.1 tRNA pseudouridine(38-40) synthase TruA [Flavobacteriales bacterium]